jgi:hypothetical protein
MKCSNRRYQRWPQWCCTATLVTLQLGEKYGQNTSYAPYPEFKTSSQDFGSE